MAILNIKLPTNLTEYPNSFKRQGSFPLEAYSVFYAIADAKNYAKNNPIAYVGQIITVIENNEVKNYSIINVNGDLEEVGKKLEWNEF